MYGNGHDGELNGSFDGHMQGQGQAHGHEHGGACAKVMHKRSKSKSKVWEKVAWFTRRSRSREIPAEGATVPDPDMAVLPLDVMELDISPSHSSTDPYPPLGSNSSSESELFEGVFYEGCHVKRSRLYPNSEVIEQNCLKPSMARALFHQMEAASQRTGKLPKYAWQKKKKKHTGGIPRTDSFHGHQLEALEDDILSRALSMPNEITGKSLCHCAACCSCTPSERLMGACPAYARLSTSTTSLDTGLDLTSSCNKDLAPCVNQNGPTFDQPPTSSTYNNDQWKSKAIEPQFSVDQTQYKSNSLPSNYGKKCKVCNRPQGTKSHLPFSHRPLFQIQPEGGLGSSNFCQCKTLSSGSKSQTARCSKGDIGADVKPKVVKETLDAMEFRTRREMLRQWFMDFNDEQKNLVLKDFLGECELPQIHLLSLAMEPRLHEGCPPNCQDLLTWLPPSTAIYILSFLDPVSLCRAALACQSWYSLATDPGLWRNFCCHPKWRLSRAGEQKQLIQHMMPPNGNIHWKRVFAERYRLRNNWLKGKCNVRTFEGHTQGISCVQFDDTRIVSGSSDKTIKVWNIRTNTPWSVQTLVGHSGTVRCLHLEGNRLVSGSTDKTIKVWDLSTQQSWSSIACKVTMVGHTDTVRCLQVDDEKVISGSYDRTLKVWDIRSGQCRMTLRGHDAAVLCVQFDDTKIVSGSCDKTIKVWTFSGSCVTTFPGHHDAVTCLQFDDTRIVSGSLDCNLKFWDVHTGRCNNTIDWKASEGHTGVVRCLQADSWRVVSASDDRTLKVWSLETGQRLVTLRNHTDGVTCLQFNDSIIVSGSYDKTVKLWDFSSC